MEALISDVEQFYLEVPSLLSSPFDLEFFVEVLIDRVQFLRGSFDGSLEWWGEECYPVTRPVLDASLDISRTGIRARQAANFQATRIDRNVQGALLVLMSGVSLRQRPESKVLMDGVLRPVPSSFPQQPFDYLFMVMAVDYALAPGRPTRTLLEDLDKSPDVGGLP